MKSDQNARIATNLTLENIDNYLSQTREEFNQKTTTIRSELDKGLGECQEALRLVGGLAKITDDERYAIEVLAVAFRRVIASITLLENGFSQEAFLVLRNCLELMLIAIDITYSREGLGEWINTLQSGATNAKGQDWYFKKSKICRRIEANENEVFPAFEREKWR